MKRIRITALILVALVVLFVVINVFFTSKWVYYVNFFTISLVGSAVGYIIGAYEKNKCKRKTEL